MATVALCLASGGTGIVHATTVPETFSLAITATNGHDGVFTLGMDPAATATGDPDFDVVLPPAVPGGADVAFLGAQPFPRLSTDIQATAAAGAVWRLRVTVPTGHPITLAWPAPTGAYLATRALRLLPVGGGAEVNMKTTFTLVVTTTTTYYIVVAEGGNRAPVANPDLALASGDDLTPAGITIPVLANDGDPNGDVLRVASATSPTAAGGTVTLGADGLSVRYTPGLGRYGADSFSYVVTDDHALPLTASAAVIVSISGPNWVPPADPPNTMTVHAVVRLPDGTFVGAAASLLAAFKGSAIRGTATIFDGPALPLQFQLSVGAGVSSETGLALRVYDRAAQRVYQIRQTLDFTAGTTLGLSTAPIEYTAEESTVSLPALSIAAASVTEGNSGSASLDFTVTLSASSTATVTVNYASADGSATTANNDYVAAIGTLTFTPGQTSRTITVAVNGDTTVEPDETLSLTLSSPANATLATAVATGTIRNDDEASVGPPDWQPPSGLLNTMTVHAVVRLADSSFVSAAGSRLAAFKGDGIRGVCTIFNGPATPMQFQLSVGSNSSSDPGLTLKVYDSAAGAVYDLDETIGFVADGTLGTITTPLEFTARSPLPELPTLSLAAASVTEGNSGSASLDFTVTLSASSTATVTVNYASADGSATTANNDYVAANGTLSFSPGQTSRTLSLQVTGDTAVETDETLTLTLSSPANATLATAVATGTIRNDDRSGGGPPDWLPPGGLLNTMTVHAVVLLSDATFVSATGSMLAAFKGDTIRGGSATANNDYVAANGTLSFSPGQTSRTLSLQVTGDTAVETDETLTLTLSNPANATLATAVATGTIRNDDSSPGLPTLSLAAASVTEGNSGSASLDFTVTLSASSTSTVTVNYASADGSATVAGADYVAASGTLSFSPGQTSRTIAVQINGDTTVESDETFTVTLSSPTNATLATAVATGTLRNDDSSGGGTGKPDWQPPSGLLNTMTVHAVVQRSDSSYVSATGSMLAAFKGDTIRGVCNIFNGPATPMQFQLSVGSNGTSEPGISLRVYDAAADMVYDITESVDFAADTTIGSIVVPRIFRMSAGASGASLSIADLEQAEGNSGTTAFVFTVQLSSAASSVITVSYATADSSAVAGSDYLAASGELTFAAGETTKTITISANGDSTSEGNEVFYVNLTNPVNATLADAQAVGTIRNDDGTTLPTVTIQDAAGYEGGQAAFVVALDLASTATVSVNLATADGSATVAGGDYSATSVTLQFTPGQTRQTVLVGLRSDSSTEATETFVVNLSNPLNAILAADRQGQGSIYDGAAPTLAIGDARAAEGSVMQFTVTLSRTTSAAVTVQYATADGSASVANGDYQAASGTLTFTAGQTTQAIPVTLGADSEAEADETFRLVLSAASGATLADAEATGLIVGSTVPWYPSFPLEPEGIASVTIRRNDGTIVLEDQAVDFDLDGQHTFAARHYKHGTGSGRQGLLPASYVADVAVWDQDFQEFMPTGILVQLPPVSYSRAAAPAPATMRSLAVAGSNRNWILQFTGTVQAQGFEIEIRDTTSATLSHQIVEEFLPATPADTFPSGPAAAELTRVLLPAAGAFQWRLRFFTPLDPPDPTTEAWNWSAWMALVALSDTTIDPDRKPDLPPVDQRWYYPEPGAEFSADAATAAATVDLSWSPVANADAYYVYLCTSEGRVVVNRQRVAATHLPGLALTSGTYFWALCPANTALGVNGIADAWMEPFPFFTVLPGASADPGIPGAVSIDFSRQPTGAMRGGDGFVHLPLTWTGRAPAEVRILVLTPGIMLDPSEDRNAAVDWYGTDLLDAVLTPGKKTLVRVQGIGAEGQLGPWSAFVQIVIPAVP